MSAAPPIFSSPRASGPSTFAAIDNSSSQFLLSSLRHHVEPLLKYSFRCPALLLEALTHESVPSSAALCSSYRRLKFLGEAVLEWLIAKYLRDSSLIDSLISCCFFSLSPFLSYSFPFSSAMPSPCFLSCASFSLSATVMSTFRTSIPRLFTFCWTFVSVAKLWHDFRFSKTFDHYCCFNQSLSFSNRKSPSNKKNFAGPFAAELDRSIFPVLQVLIVIINSSVSFVMRFSAVSRIGQ